MSTKCVPLHIAALKGNWESAEKYFEKELRNKITDQEETALHIAAAAKKLSFVEKLVNHLQVAFPSHLNQFLETENSNGNTALCYAAISGNVQIAEVMIDAYSITTYDHYNPLANRGNVKPLYMAAMFGQCDMVKYLIGRTKIKDWSGDDRVELFTNCISIGLCGEALEMLKVYPELATTENSDHMTGLYVLARNAFVFVPQSEPGWRRYIGSYDDNKNPRVEAVELVKKLYHLSYNNPDLEEASRRTEIPQALLAAAEKGNIDFIIELIRLDPDLVWKFNERQGSIFHIAVLNRHEDIFSLLPELGSVQDLTADRVLDGDRNMLHLAAELAPQTQLNMVSGAALQMQRELLWFKEVENIVRPSYKEMLDSEGKTPHMVFIESHKDLMAAGEKWMKETAKSSMVVAALIATVVFTTAFTVPGGYNGTSGEPIFENQTCFLIFAVADALALVCASTSILMFHSIITSRYTENDFLESLPFKLMVGVAALFVSVAAMMVAFCVPFLLYYPRNKVPWMFGLLALFTCVPSIYITVKYPLLVDLIRSTYASRFMFQSRKQLFL